MKLPFAPRKQTMRATTATAGTRRSREVESDEPNVRLSSAFVVVLILHIVAIGGIYAFSSISAHQKTASFDEPPLPQHTEAENVASQESAATGEPTPAPMPEQPAAIPPANFPGTKLYKVKSGDTLPKIAVANSVAVDDLLAANNLHPGAVLHAGQELKMPAGGKPMKAAGTGVKDSGALYTVAKGDNPVGIARKLHVTYDDLLKLNKIQDPKKLQIGQKLKVPVKHGTAA